ncbi:MAG: sugar ABC transporter substrate-binding protein [Limnochordaceae bacterium]|nr:sugar ABC transporter substrate-binding protein [Limnochordaceae bacterium]
MRKSRYVGSDLVSRRKRVSFAAVMAVLAVSTLGVTLPPTAAAASSTATPLRVMVWGSQLEIGTYNRILDAWRQAHPDIPVRLEPTTFWEYLSKLQVQVAADSAPDIVLLSGAFIPDLVDEGALTDLNPFIQQYKFPLEDYWDTHDILRVNGKMYALPMFGDVAALYYNRSAFDRAGVGTPNADWKWDDLREAARKLTVRSGDTTKQYGVMWAVSGNGQSSYVNFLLQNGVRVLNDTRTSSLIDTEPAVKAIQYWTDIILRDGSAPRPDVLPATGEAFVAEKGTMIYHLVALPINLFETAKFDWDVAPMPIGPKQRASEANFVGFGMMAGSRQKEKAWKLLSFLVGEQSQSIFAAMRQNLPALRKAIAAPAFADPRKPPRNLLPTLQVTMPYTYDLQFTKGWMEWSNLLGETMVRISQGQVGVENGLRELADKIDTVLRRVNAPKK